MPARDMTIINKLGLHARAAAKLVSVAGRYTAEIRVRRENRAVNGKSIMGLMMLAAGKGTVITVEAEGADAEAALDAIEALISNRFQEEE